MISADIAVRGSDMNYIDRKSIALERFFAKRSELLSHLDDFTEDDLRDAIQDLFPLRKLMLAVIIRDSLRYLRENYQLVEHIPEALLASAGLSAHRFIKEGHFSDFLFWLRKIHLRNAQQRIPWETSLKTAASRLKAPADTFLRTFFSLSNQRIFITLEGDELVISPAEREWGHAVIKFTDCRFEHQPVMPLPGFSVAAEADLSDKERIGLSILIDTRFGDAVNDLADRLLSDEGWQTVSFSCSDITLEAEFTDYVGRMRARGASRAETVFDSCRILLNKRLIIGSDGLNSRERSLMPIASLLGAADAYITSINSGKDHPPFDFADWQYDDLILDSLSNRCVMQSFVETLRKYGCRDLAAVLEKASLESYIEDNEKALSTAKMFGVGVNKKLGNGTLRPLLHHLSTQFSEASALNTGSTESIRTEALLISELSKTADGRMSDMGFTGSFPDYRRTRDDQTDYISFMVERRSSRINKGVVSYSAVIAAAQLDNEKIKQYEQYGVSADEITAIDSLAEDPEISRCSELCDHHDGGPAIFDLELYSCGRPVIIHDDTEKLLSYLKTAEHQFLTGRLPSDYRRHLSPDTALGTFGRAFVYCLPYAVAAVILLLVVYLFGSDHLPVSLSAPTAVAAACGIGIIINCILSIIRCAVCSRRLWRY